jgi:DNA-binding GntR family transcriptional regulator
MPARRKRKRPGQTADQIFTRLIEMILSGRFPCGSVLRETSLAREWNTGRTAVREAMRRATQGGFIVLRPNRAPLIRLLTVDEIRNIYDVREVLEFYALELAWPRMREQQIKSLQALAEQADPSVASDWVARCSQFDLALHALWMQCSGNSWLVADLERHYQFLRVFQSWIGSEREPVAKSYGEHVCILKALAQRNKNEVVIRLRHHIRASAYRVERARLKQERTDEGERRFP